MAIVSSPMKARIKTRFNERKTVAAACVLLQEAGGQISYLTLIKLLYLTDRESWLKHNRPITGDNYVAMKYGPVLSNTYKLIREERQDEVGAWSEAIERVGRYDLRLKQVKPDYGPLSDSEIEILKEAFCLNEKVDPWQLCDLTHAFLEWSDPHALATPIWPEDILKALGKSEGEIEEARQEATERGYFDEIFSG